jgi:hypothetical protein
VFDPLVTPGVWCAIFPALPVRRPGITDDRRDPSSKKQA